MAWFKELKKNDPILPDGEYARAKAIDYGKMAEMQEAFSERYLKEVQ